MAKLYYDKDADLGLLKGKVIGIIGYGSQGHAHALNHRDSGLEVMVGLYKGSKSWDKAKADGLKVGTVQEVSEAAQVIMIALPDQTHKQVYEESMRRALTPGKTLMFAHGFNIHFNQIVPPRDVDVIMVAPKGPGHLVRRQYEEGKGVPSLIAVHQDTSGKAKDLALAYAKGIGATRAGVIETTFSEETETDLFGEQAVLCGGVTELIMAGFDTLVEAGYQPEIAYFECLHELKLIVDLIWEKGISGMRYSISDTAEYGDLTRGPVVVNEGTRDRMRGMLADIRTGAFAREWILENQAGRPSFLAMRQRESDHPVEVVGKQLRGMMSWLKSRR